MGIGIYLACDRDAITDANSNSCEPRDVHASQSASRNVT